MKIFRFSPVGLLYIHPLGNDLIIHGDPKRTDVEIQASTIPEGAQVYPIEVLDAETHIRISGPITVNVPDSISLFVEGEVADTVIQRVAHVALDDCLGDVIVSEITSLRCNGQIKGNVALRKISRFATLQRVQGDLVASDVASLRTDDVRGDVSLTNVNAIQMAIVKHNFTLVHAGSVQIKEVAGDVKINNIRESIAIKRIGRDLEVISAGTTLAATEVLGNVRLNGPLLKNGKYWINAGGAVVVQVSGDVRIAVRAAGEVFAGDDLHLVQEKGDLMTAQLGAAEMAADLNIVAGSDVILNSPGRWQKHRRAVIDAELQKAMQDVQGEIKQALGDVGSHVRSTTTAIADEIQQQVSADTLGPTVRNVVRDILSALETAIPPRTPPASAPPRPEEMQMVLQMLEQGTISVEEAESLIDALRL
ncbi:MAG: DUF2089 domain-containing protein [Chloroflexi bacterium]|nr:DUF2089 domain-containing protein [Chloroflexota bacterium]